jgi:hypothetical protein
MPRRGGWFRSPGGGGTVHLLGSKLPHQCAAPALPGDNLAVFGGRCGRMASHLCDWPTGAGTCDAAMCDAHRTNTGPDRDVCPEHSNGYAQLELPIQGGKA